VTAAPAPTPAAPAATPTSAFGVAAVMVVTGILLLAWPGATTLVLVALLGLGAVTYGIAELSRVFAGEGERLELWAGLIGLVSIFGGVLIFLTPLVSSVAVGTIIGAYWLVGGVSEVIGAVIRPGGRVVRLLVGVLSVAAGLVVLASPTLSLVALVWFSGLWMVAAGIAIAIGGLLHRPRASGGRSVTA
jgi:uncharacterized membrane protein HdeD (DUF308 family)